VSSAVLTKEESSQDSKGQLTTSQTWESFTEPPPAPPGAKNLRRSHADGKYTLVCEWTPPDPAAGESYSVEGSMSQEPIETHKLFKDVSAQDWKQWNLWKNNASDPALGGWTPDTAPLSILADLYNKGVTDYLVPKAVVRITRIESNSPNLVRLGSITQPSGAPQLPQGCDWLLTGASGTMDSTKADGQPQWSNTYEYISSGPAGWNPIIYG